MSHLKKADERLAKVIKKVGPCRLFHAEQDRLWVLVSSIASQQLSNKAAATILARVTALIGDDSRALCDRICGVDPVDLKGCGLSAAKAACVRSLAQAVQAGELDLDALTTQSDEDVSAALRVHRGVGPWTVQMFLIFGLGRADVFSLGDVGLRRGLMLLHGLEDKPSDDDVTRLTDHWRPYRTVAAWYLWRLLD